MSTFDDYAVQRQQETRETLAERELAELAEGTEAIKRGMANPFLWAMLIGGIVATPFTGGISLLVSLVAGVAMSGGPDHMARAAMPMSVDVVAPQWGCMRVVASVLTIVLVILTALLIVAIVAFNAGVRP